MAIIDSTDFLKAVQKAVEDSLRKSNTYKTDPPNTDTVLHSLDSVMQMPAVERRDNPIQQEQGEIEKKKKSSTVDGGKNYFNVTGINFQAISEKAGMKPEVTSLATETNKFLLSFVLQNKLLRSGVYTIYIVITKPDQKVLRSGNPGNDYFLASNEGLRIYTKKIQFSYVPNKRKTITSIINNENFSSGVYTVRIYFNGKKIGESTTKLTKEGLMG